MKVLSKPQGDALLTNAEVMHWLKSQDFDATDNSQAKDEIAPPENEVTIGQELLTYFSTTPSGKLNQMHMWMQTCALIVCAAIC